MSLQIRPAHPADAGFLAWLMLTAGRGHVRRGIWEAVLGGTEEDCLGFLRLLCVTHHPHLFHYSCCLVAGVDGEPAAGLGGYDPAELGMAALREALPEVIARLEGPVPEALTSGVVPRVVQCVPEPVPGAWVIDSVATRPRFRGRGIAGSLLGAMLERGRRRGFRRAQVNIFIGNAPAQRLYERHGFWLHDEVRDPYFEAETGAPGMASLLRDL